MFSYARNVPHLSQSHIMRRNDVFFLLFLVLVFLLKKGKKPCTCSIEEAVNFHVVSVQGTVKDWLKKERCSAWRRWKRRNYSEVIY